VVYCTPGTPGERAGGQPWRILSWDNEEEQQMEIRTETLKRSVLVTVSGEVNSATAPELDQLLRDQIAAGHKNLVVNLSDVSFMSSAGLQALIGAQMKVRRLVPPGNVVLSEVPPRLKETFELVGFHHVFTLYDSNTEAVGSF